MCLSVYVDISRTTRKIFTNFCACCLWPWLCPPLAGWQNTSGNGQFWYFFSPLTMHSIWGPYKNGLTDRESAWDDEWAWSKKQCVMWGDDPEGEGVIWGETCPTSLLPITELDWSRQRHTMGRRLITSIGRVYYWPRSGVYFWFCGWHCFFRQWAV